MVAASSSSSSTSSIHKSFKYHVYVSFSEDIRNTIFLDHLFEALLVEGICTFKDDEKLTKGETINDDLLKVIEESKFFIIVLSKNYTSSSWCLNELVKIMECSKTSHQMTFPIFYYVDPDEVGSEFGEAFDIHDKKEVAKWRWALKEATIRISRQFRNSVVNNRNEAKVIDEIVKRILLDLSCTNLWGDVNLVGMDARAEDVVSSLETGFEDALMIGIKGIGGIGKTTLAKTIYGNIYNQFDGSSFVEVVGEVSRASGLASLQKKILSDVLHDEDITVGSVLYGKSMMKEKLHCKKVLLVLDDVDHRDQLEALAGAPDWFKPGSRIIVTTRDEQVLLAHGVKCIHTVECLLHEEAIYLFSRHAFGRDIPIQGYEELSRQFVRYTAGIPLRIKVLGSFLCGKKELQWVDALERLKAFPLAETPELLELSYNDLDVDCKEKFLDVACFLKGFSIDNVIKILGFHTKHALRILEKKSLITITDNQYVVMHPLIEAVGKDIVRRVHLNDPHRYSRLWIRDEIEYILAEDLVTEATKAIAVDSPVKLCSEVVTKGFGSMPNLRLLRVVSEIEDDCDEKIGQTSLNFPNALQFLSWEGYPYWSLPKRFKAYNLVALEMPFSRITQLWEGGEERILLFLKFLNLKHSRLRTLDLRLTPRLERLDLEGCNDLVELHLGGQGEVLLFLKFLNLKHSRLRTLDLQQTPNLESLDLEGCNDLVELHLGGQGEILYDLKFLNLKHSRLRTLDLQLTPNLERLDLEGCNDLVELWEGGERKMILYNLKFLNLKHSRLKTLDLRLTPYLERLDLEGCNDLVELHLPHIGYLESLVYANLSGCSRIKKSIPEKGTLQELEFRYIGLPDHTLKEIFLDVACLLKGLLKDDVIRIIASTSKYIDGKYALRVLEEASLISIDDNHYVVMHPHIEEMGKNIVHRMHLDKPNQQSRLWIREEIEYILANDLGTEATKAIVVDSPVELSSQIVTKGFGSMENLRLLGVVSEIDDDCDKKIGRISLTFPNKLRFLSWVGYPHGSLPKSFDADNLVALEMPYSRITQLWEGRTRKTLSSLKFLNLRHTQLRTLDLGLTPNLERLELEGCNDLVELLHTPITRLTRLVYLNLSGCLRIKSFEFIKELGSLEILSLSRLYLKEFPDIIPRHRDISLLELQFRYNDIEEVPSSIENLQKLVCLDFHSCRKLRRLPDSICALQHLRNLKLYGCCCLEELPEDIGRLGCLEKLNLSYTSIKHLPDSICKLNRLKTLKLSFCRNLEKLPGDIGELGCLEKLVLMECTQVKDIPDSICRLRNLKYLNLLDCIKLEKLPKSVGNLVSLEVLNVKGTRIRQLPPSISKLIHLEIHAPKKDRS